MWLQRVIFKSQWWVWTLMTGQYLELSTLWKVLPNYVKMRLLTLQHWHQPQRTTITIKIITRIPYRTFQYSFFHKVIILKDLGTSFEAQGSHLDRESSSRKLNSYHWQRNESLFIFHSLRGSSSSIIFSSQKDKFVLKNKQPLQTSRYFSTRKAIKSSCFFHRVWIIIFSVRIQKVTIDYSAATIICGLFATDNWYDTSKFEQKHNNRQ